MMQFIGCIICKWPDEKVILPLQYLHLQLCLSPYLSIILGLGFGVLGVANLVILQKFGLFTMVAIVSLFSRHCFSSSLLRMFKLTK